MAPADMRQVFAKAERAAVAAGFEDPSIMPKERGMSFESNNLGLICAAGDNGGQRLPSHFRPDPLGCLPGGLGDRSGGERHPVPALARAAAGARVDGVSP